MAVGDFDLRTSLAHLGARYGVAISLKAVYSGARELRSRGAFLQNQLRGVVAKAQGQKGPRVLSGQSGAFSKFKLQPKEIEFFKAAERQIKGNLQPGEVSLPAVGRFFVDRFKDFSLDKGPSRGARPAATVPANFVPTQSDFNRVVHQLSDQKGNAQTTIDWYKNKYGPDLKGAGAFERSAVKRAENLLATIEDPSRFFGGLSSKEIDAGARAEEQVRIAERDAVSASKPKFQGFSDKTKIQHLKSRGFTDKQIAASLSKQGVDESEAFSLIDEDRQQSRLLPANEQNISAALSTFNQRDQELLNRQLNSPREDVRQFALDKLNKTVGLGQSSAQISKLSFGDDMDFQISDASNPGTERFIAEAQNILGDDSKEILDILKLESQIGTDAVDSQAFNKIRSLQAEGVLAKGDAIKLTDFLVDRRNFGIDKANVELQQMQQNIQDSIRLINEQTNADVADVLIAKDEAISRAQGALARMGILDSGDAIRIIGNVEKQYDRQVTRLQNERVLQLIQFSNQAQGSFDKAVLAKREIELDFNKSMLKAESDTNRQLFELRQKAFETDSERTKAIAEIRMNQLSQIGKLIENKRTIEDKVALDIIRTENDIKLARVRESLKGSKQSAPKVQDFRTDPLYAKFVADFIKVTGKDRVPDSTALSLFPLYKNSLTGPQKPGFDSSRFLADQLLTPAEVSELFDEEAEAEDVVPIAEDKGFFSFFNN